MEDYFCLSLRKTDRLEAISWVNLSGLNFSDLFLPQVSPTAIHQPPLLGGNNH